MQGFQFDDKIKTTPKKVLLLSTPKNPSNILNLSNLGASDNHLGSDDVLLREVQRRGEGFYRDFWVRYCYIAERSGYLYR